MFAQIRRALGDVPQRDNGEQLIVSRTSCCGGTGAIGGKTGCRNAARKTFVGAAAATAAW